jgi:competence protein ComEA
MAIVVSTPPPSATPPPTPTPRPLRVHVAGAVERPGVYELRAGSIVLEAIEAAGGPAPGAEPGRINLALELRDQQQVYLPAAGEPGAPPPVSGGVGGGKGGGEAININTATPAELEALPRIGPATAAKIVAYRETNGPFESIEEIQDVPGIGPATFEGLKELITVGW